MIALRDVAIAEDPRQSAWMTTFDVDGNCDADCGGWPSDIARVQAITTPAQFLRANRAMNLRSRLPYPSTLIHPTEQGVPTDGVCAVYDGRQFLSAPRAEKIVNSTTTEMKCFYDGTAATGSSSHLSSNRLCCCLDGQTSPPEDATTACPVVSADCDQVDYMALDTTYGGPKEGICLEFNATSCPAGHWADLSTKQCVACTPGKYAVARGQMSEKKTCVVCPAGTHGAEEAQSSEAGGCHQCVAGKTSEIGATRCRGDSSLGWVIGEPKMNCDRVCANGGGGSCRATRMQAITTEQDFETVLAAVLADRGAGTVNGPGLNGACRTDGWSLTTGMSTSPARYDTGQCNYNGGSSACGSVDGTFAKERICCCAEAALETQMCALTKTDCTQGWWWNTLLKRCISCESGKYGSSAGAGKTTESEACTASHAVCAAGSYGLRGRISISASVPHLPPVYPPETLVSGDVKRASLECTTPPSGRYAPISGGGLDTLTLCPRGKVGASIVDFYDTEALGCPELCPAGKWAPSAGLASVAQCVDCTPGRFSASPGITSNTECIMTCGPGRYNPPGTQVGSLDDCTACSAGKWSNRSALTADSDCEGLCPQGTFGTGTGQTSALNCSLCPQGKFSNLFGNSAEVQCAGVCPAGTHGGGAYGLVAALQCLDCPAGRFSGAVALTLEDQCGGLCEQGKYSNTRGLTSLAGCVDCSGNAIAQTGQSECIQCSRGEQPNEKRSSCTRCASNEFRIPEKHPTKHFVHPKKGRCVACPAFGVSCLNGELQIKTRVWLPPRVWGNLTLDENTVLYRCFNDECCVTPPPFAYTVTCNAEKGYMGPLCGACDRDNVQGRGRFTRSGSGCLACWRDSFVWLASCAMACALFVGVAYLVVHHTFAAPRGEYGGTVQKMMMSHLQVGEMHSPSLLCCLTRVRTAQCAHPHPLPHPLCLRVCVLFTHPTHQMLGVLGIFKARGTAIFNEVVNRPAEVLGGSFTSLMPIKCALKSQVYGPFLLNMSIPFIVVALAGLVMVPKMMWEKHARRKRIRNATPVPSFKGKFNVPRVCTPCRTMRLPMTPNDVAGWSAVNFSAQGRFAGVLVFAMFTHYPTLVSSIASIWNCTAAIDGVRYLVADLSVVCYAPLHLWFVALACVGAVVYALGIPFAIAYATALKTPLVCRRSTVPVPAGAESGGRQGTMSARLRRDAMRWTAPQCVCKRREAAAYTRRKMRSRFAFLYNGYSTDRSGVVVAWESLVMLRKLTVTLAGSVISDPYLQILSAQLLLVVTALATAYAQPYETWWLNLLDIGGLFALILTQILSILYFYAESAVHPFMDRAELEVIVTAILLLLNLATAVCFLCAFGSEMAGLRLVLEMRGKVQYKIAGKSRTERELEAARIACVGHAARVADAERPQGRDSWADATAAAGAAADVMVGNEGAAAVASQSILWRHPSGVAVKEAPMKTTNQSGDVVWLYSHPTVTASTAAPELLLVVTDSVTIIPGDHYRWMHPLKSTLSEVHVEFADVGGWSPLHTSSGGNDQEGDDHVVVGNGLELALVHGLDADDAAIDLGLETDRSDRNDAGGVVTSDGRVDVRNPMPDPNRPMSGI